jgi:Domain of unknown function (DUF4863)
MSQSPQVKEVPPNQIAYRKLLSTLTAAIEGKALDEDLDQWLNEHHGVGCPLYEELKTLTIAGVMESWLCNREGAGIKYGRIFKPSDDLNGFSVDVVDMENIVGPRHIHPLGEIDLIMPISGEALFDGRSAGWMVTPPGSEHAPTVSNGRAYVLYLLPQGQIQFTQS